MRLFVTGGTGFVGSNVVKVAIECRDALVTTTAHSYAPTGDEPYEVVRVDMTETGDLKRAVRDASPDAIIHAAILKDFRLMYADRPLAWDSYVGSTRALVEVGAEIGAHMVLVSTDWVFDGSQSAATEHTPPNPINLYGVLKVVGETIVTEAGGAVARVAGVNGVHWARNDYAPAQDPGMGHFAGAVVLALRAGKPFTVWRGAVNEVATPSLASHSAEMILRIIERGERGIFHCCGGQSVDRVGFARAVARTFDLDDTLIATGPPDLSGVCDAPVPRDTSLDAGATARALDCRLLGLDELLSLFRYEWDRRELAPVS